MEHWCGNKISLTFNLFSAWGNKLQRYFNIITNSIAIVTLGKMYGVVVAGILISMMFMMSVSGGTVVVAVKKFKGHNLTLLVRADNSPAKAGPIGEAAGDGQKPNNHFFRC